MGTTAAMPWDDLVFPAVAARFDTVNDYPPGTQFGSISFLGGDYQVSGGILSSGKVEVSAGTLTTTSIVADTLTIGAAPAAPCAVSESGRWVSAVLEPSYSLVADTLAIGTPAASAAIANGANGANAPAMEDAAQSAAINVAEVQPVPTNMRHSSVGQIANLPSFRQVGDLPSFPQVGNLPHVAILMERAVKLAGLPFMAADAAAFLAARSETVAGISLSGPRFAARRIIDAVFEESTGAPTEATQQSIYLPTESQTAYDLALHSIVMELQDATKAEEQPTHRAAGRSRLFADADLQDQVILGILPGITDHLRRYY
jgi:hypothetical protein